MDEVHFLVDPAAMTEGMEIVSRSLDHQPCEKYLQQAVANAVVAEVEIKLRPAALDNAPGKEAEQRCSEVQVQRAQPHRFPIQSFGKEFARLQLPLLILVTIDHVIPVMDGAADAPETCIGTNQCNQDIKLNRHGRTSGNN